MNDSVFGELEYNYAWAKCMPITFLGNETEIDLMIDIEIKNADPDMFSESINEVIQLI